MDLSPVRRGASDRFGLAYDDAGSFLFVDIGGDGYADMVIQFANATVSSSDIRWAQDPEKSDMFVVGDLYLLSDQQMPLIDFTGSNNLLFGSDNICEPFGWWF